VALRSDMLNRVSGRERRRRGKRKCYVEQEDGRPGLKNILTLRC
jgi:hypothetical protein